MLPSRKAPGTIFREPKVERTRELWTGKSLQRRSSGFTVCGPQTQRAKGSQDPKVRETSGPSFVGDIEVCNRHPLALHGVPPTPQALFNFLEIGLVPYGFWSVGGVGGIGCHRAISRWNAEEFPGMSAMPRKAAKYLVFFPHHLLDHPMDVGKGGTKRTSLA
jgi:hypothetical protein